MQLRGIQLLKRSTLTAVLFGLTSSAPFHAPAQGTDTEDKEVLTLEEVVVVGTRRHDRTALDTPVPIDVFGLEDLESVPSPELLDTLNTLAPSFTVQRWPLGDGASFIRPPTMRGLDSDKTLVLVNGKRRHRGVLVQLSGSGSHGPDLASISTFSLRNIEVLRDGASAMYGSDAIAGVINLNLKDSAEGGQIQAQYGQFSEDDEQSWIVSGNFGLPLGNNGFVNITIEASDDEQTSRGVEYDRTIGQSGLTPAESALVSGLYDHDDDPDTPDQQRFGPDALTEVWIDGQLVSLFGRSDGVPDDTDTRFADNLRFAELSDSELVQIWGRPEREMVGAVINAGYELSNGTSLYGWATYSNSEANRNATHRRVGRGAMLPLRTADGEIYDPRNLFPSGFTPRFFGEITDYGFTGGITGTRKNGLTWDFGGRYGQSEIEYQITNTMNPSLGPATPTAFRPGDLTSDEVALTADFTLPLELEFAVESQLAFGLEYKEEGYESGIGDPASFAVGPYSFDDPWDLETSEVEAAAGENGGVVECRIPGLESIGTPCPALDPIHNVQNIGSEAFPGYSSLAVFDYDRDNWAAYAELDMDINERFLLSLAGRYEDYSDFGNNFSWRVAARFEFNDQYAMRGSVGTGFRAPTPGQISTLSVQSIPGQTVEPTLSGIFPPSHPAAQVFGAVPLDAETSEQWTVGFTATPFENLIVTLDFYQIAVDDRFNRSSAFDVGEEERQVLIDSGVPGANAIDLVSFFNNDIDTETEGIDLVATWRHEWGGGLTTLTAAANWNKTTVTRRTPREGGFWVNDRGVYNIENNQPRPRAVLGMGHAWSNGVDFLVRGSYYGDYSFQDSRSGRIQDFSSVFQVGFNLNWSIRDGRYRLTLGGENVFDELPDEGEFQICCGLLIRRDSVMDWQGPFYYLRGGLRW